MNNLMENYEIILKKLKITSEDIESYLQIKLPKLSNLELVAINLIAEYMSINTDLQLFRCLKGSYIEPLIERSVYNKRRKKLFGYTEAIRKRIIGLFNKFTDVL